MDVIDNKKELDQFIDDLILFKKSLNIKYDFDHRAGNYNKSECTLNKHTLMINLCFHENDSLTEWKNMFEKAKDLFRKSEQMRHHALNIPYKFEYLKRRFDFYI